MDIPESQHRGRARSRIAADTALFTASFGCSELAFAAAAGLVIKTIGDEVMAVMGWHPTPKRGDLPAAPNSPVSAPAMPAR